MVSIPTKGWFAYVVDPDTSRNITVTPLSDPQFVPSANTLPEIRMPVPRDGRWQDIDLSQEPSMFLYNDGERLPIEILEQVETRPDRNVLHGVGGDELRERGNFEFRLEEIDEAVKTILNTTTYTVNVDDYPETLSTETAQEADTTAEFNDVFIGVTTGTGRFAQAKNGNIEVAQTCFLGHDNITDLFSAGGSPATTSGEADAVDKDAWILDASGDFVRYEGITLEADLDVGTTNLAFRIKGSCNAADLKINGTVVQSVTAINGPDEGTNDYSWVKFESINTPSDLTVANNDHTCGIELTANPDDGGGERLFVDCIVLYNNAESITYTFPDDTDANDEIAGPELYPSIWEISANVYFPTTRGIRSAALTTEWNNTENNQQVRIRDPTTTYTTNNGTDVSTGTLASLVHWVQASIDLSRYGSRTDESPTQGFNGQKIQSFDLKTDLSDEPFIVHNDYDDRKLPILQQLTEPGDALFEVRQDGATTSVEWTHPGQRSSDTTFGAEDFQAQKTAESLIETAAIYGSSKQREESFTADVGNWVDLGQDKVKLASETIVSIPTAEEGQDGTLADYEMDYFNGRIKAHSGGDLDDGVGYDIRYEYRAYGEYTDPNVTGKTIIESFPDAPDDRACRQIAFTLVQQLNTVLIEGQLTIPGTDTSFSAAEDIGVSAFPFDTGRIEVRDIAVTPADTVIDVGNRKTLEDAIQEVSRRLSQLSRRS